MSRGPCLFLFLFLVCAAPAEARPGGKVDCDALRGGRLVEAIAERRCKGGARRGGIRVRVSIKGYQSTDWSERYERIEHPGTERECRLGRTGAGEQDVTFRTRPVRASLYSADGRTLRFGTRHRLRGIVARRGMREANRSGRGCEYQSAIADSSACGSAEIRGGDAIEVTYSGRAIRIRSRGFEAGARPLAECPFSGASSFRDRFVSTTNDRFVPVVISPARLVARRTVHIRDRVARREHLDCQSNPASCPRGTTFRDLAATSLTWTVTIRRGPV